MTASELGAGVVFGGTFQPGSVDGSSASGVTDPARALASVPEASAAGTLVTVMTSVARELQALHASVDGTLQAIIAAAVRLIPGTTGAGLVLAHSRKLESGPASDDLAKKVNSFLVEAAEGPATEAMYGQPIVRVDDVAADVRWPRFAGRAAAEGAGSLLCLGLLLEVGGVGVLTVCSPDRYAFTDLSERIGSTLATHAAVAIAGAEQEAGLLRSVSNRDLIGQAKGIIMERYKTTADEAFALLTEVSQLSNTRLHDVAEDLATSGELPTVQRPRRRATGRPSDR